MGAFTYPRSEPGSAGHLDLVERLNAFAVTLREDCAGLPEASLTYSPGDGEWSIKQIVSHLCDDSRYLHQRLTKMIDLEDPRLPAFDEQEVQRQRDAQNAPIGALLDEFASQRAETVDVLSGLVHWNWSRTGRHEEFGRLSIRQMVDRTIGHEELHLAQIQSITAAT